MKGNRFKAGFHCHTVNSDGGLDVMNTLDRYRKAGFDCLAVTDHRQVTRTPDALPEDFLFLEGTENGGDPDIIGVGVRQAVDVGLPLAERARRLSEQGGMTIAAHPTYCGVLPQTYIECPKLMAMEIYNAYCDEAYANGYATELWDMVLGQGKRIWGVAGDDAHLNPAKRYYSDAGKGYVEIWAGQLTRRSVLSALKAGAFFSTQGPVFKRIEVGEHTIDIECSPVQQVRWRTFGKVGYVEYKKKDAELTVCSLPQGFQPRVFVRIELVDAEGKKAWSNPIFVCREYSR